MKRKEFVLCSFIVPLGLILSACGERGEIVTWEVFHSNEFPYQIEYPSDWKCSTTPKPYLTDWFEGPLVQELFTSVAISATDLPHLTTEQYKEYFLRNVNQRTGLIGVSILAKPGDGSAWSKVGEEYDSYLIKTTMYNRRICQDPFNNVSSLFATAGKGWLITLSTHPSGLERFMPMFKHMLDAFEITRGKQKERMV